ncbi:MAG TPA: thioredoxin family protein [Dermatophilaceae bacterium]|nr:thioredoxin family protein [Dermatophilaceae bacterium]
MQQAQALADLGLAATVEKVTDYGDIAAYGVMRTPGLVVDEEVVVSGRVPTARAIAELLAGRG